MHAWIHTKEILQTKMLDLGRTFEIASDKKNV